MKKVFNPEMNVVRFGNEDVISTSAVLHWEWTVSAANPRGGYWDLTDPSGKKYRQGTDEYAAMMKLKGNAWQNVGINNSQITGTLYYNEVGVMTFRPYSN